MSKIKVEDNKKSVLIRLRRIEGQIKGIIKMLDNCCCCKEVLIQVAAVKSAINKVGIMILQNYANNCLEIGENCSDNDKVDEFVSTLTTFCENNFVSYENKEEKLKQDILINLDNMKCKVENIEEYIKLKVCSKEILSYIVEVRALANKVGSMIIQNYARNCLISNNEDVEDLFNILTMFIK